jgi:acylglycerol lipase
VVERFEDFTDILSTYYQMVKTWQPNAPIFLLGHSLGGTIAIYYSLDHQDDFKGAIISAPLIHVPANISLSTIIMGRILSILAPRVGIVPLDATGLSRDPQVVQAYISDPLVFHGKTPARLAAEMLRIMQVLSSRMNEITLPFITLQASEDRLVDQDSAQILYDKASSKDKTIKIYDGFYHEVFNEPGRDLVLKDVEDWLNAHL